MLLTVGQAWLLDRLPASIIDRIPSPLMIAMHLPGNVYCSYVIATEPRPADDIPLFEMGQAIHCYFVTLALDIPYYMIFILIGWWLLDKLRGKRVAVLQST
jgi:hypothetical protein